MFKSILSLLLIISITGLDGRRHNHQHHRLMSTNNNSTKTCDLKKMDKMATVVFVFGRRDVYLPKNEKEMKPHCREEFDAEDYVKSYARTCLRPFPRQIIGVILLGASQVIRQRCTPEGTREYLSHYKCIKTAISSLHDCMDQLVISLKETVAKPGDERIPVACCSFSRYITCSSKVIKRLCPDDPKAENYITVKMIKGYASEVLDLACQGYELESDKCKKLTLPSGGFRERPNGALVANRNTTEKPLSLIPPFIDIFTQN